MWKIGTVRDSVNSGSVLGDGRTGVCGCQRFLHDASDGGAQRLQGLNQAMINFTAVPGHLPWRTRAPRVSGTRYKNRTHMTRRPGGNGSFDL